MTSQDFELAAKKIVYENLATVDESLLRSVEIVRIFIPNFRKTCWVEVAMKPLAPTSTVSNEGFHDELLAIFSNICTYLACFLICAAAIPSSAG